MRGEKILLSVDDGNDEGGLRDCRDEGGGSAPLFIKIAPPSNKHTIFLLLFRGRGGPAFLRSSDGLRVLIPTAYLAKYSGLRKNQCIAV